MGKNNYFINNQKRIEREADNVAPAVYASLAMALHKEFGFGYIRISRAFARSQAIWGGHRGDLVGMLAKCYNETGIQLMSDRQYAKAKKLGLVEDDQKGK